MAPTRSARRQEPILNADLCLRSFSLEARSSLYLALASRLSQVCVQPTIVRSSFDLITHTNVGSVWNVQQQNTKCVPFHPAAEAAAVALWINQCRAFCVFLSHLLCYVFNCQKAKYRNCSEAWTAQINKERITVDLLKLNQTNNWFMILHWETNDMKTVQYSGLSHS